MRNDIQPSFARPEMKKIVLLGLGVVLLLAACTHLPRRGPDIIWPEEISYLRAMCELDLSWRGAKYSGSLALRLVYPSQLQMEIYGPFGDTLVFIRKNGTNFLMVTKEETVADARQFEERFGIKLDEFIEDLAMRSPRYRVDGLSFVQRENYRVLYKLANGENAMCWDGGEGQICIKFLEANFDAEGSLGKSSNGDV
ncbi:MAG: hypothetical protein A4E65_00639 [Syntrophorhabdus sp. PtaU1.Bin153]|nr:MAG: hypothetical protein A4E65_00639 [Syntrophorhabdus sp. PtaU1.Bin153]